LLAREVVDAFGDKAAFVSKDWGTSDLPARYGIDRYPVVFVDDVLVATPDDFGWFGAKGRYSPWREAASHDRFKKDLRRYIELRLRGETELGAVPSMPGDALQVARLPEFSLTDLAGRPLDRASLAGKVTLVEFWATWCAPCKTTVPWLGALQRAHADDLTVVAVAVGSEDAAARAFVGPDLVSRLRVVMGTSDLVARFGDVSAVPTLFVFDREGRTAGVFYGAPPELHEQVERLVDRLVR